MPSSILRLVDPRFRLRQRLPCHFFYDAGQVLDNLRASRVLREERHPFVRCLHHLEPGADYGAGDLHLQSALEAIDVDPGVGPIDYEQYLGPVTEILRDGEKARGVADGTYLGRGHQEDLIGDIEDLQGHLVQGRPRVYHDEIEHRARNREQHSNRLDIELLRGHQVRRAEEHGDT